MIRKLYKFSYAAGSVMVIVSMLLSLVPAVPTRAQTGSGAIWTTNTSCGNPTQNDNAYAYPESVYIHYHNFEPGISFTWSITGVSGLDQKVQIASGSGTINYEYDNGTRGCFKAYDLQPDDGGVYKAALNPAGGNEKYDNFSVAYSEPTPTPVPPVLGVTVQKSANPSSIQVPGGLISYSVTVINTSNVTVTLSSLGDDSFNVFNGDCSVPQTLDPDQTYSCSFTGEVSGTAGSSHTNTVTAVITHDSGSTSGQDQATVSIYDETVLGVQVDKSANPSSVVEPGGDVTFTVTVLNTSNVDVQLISLNDTVFGDLFNGYCTQPASITAGGSYSCSFTEYINGPHTNTVTGVIDYQGQTRTDNGTATVEYNSRPNPSITVTKTANPTQLDENGGDVTFNVSVINNHTDPVTITSIIDSVFGNDIGSCAPDGTIAGGATYNCSFTKNLSGTSGNPHNNTITVQVIDDYGKTAEGSDDATVTFSPLPTISVSKTADKATVSELGENVTFTVLVTNTSNEALTLRSFVDSVYGNVSGAGTCALPQPLAASGGTYQCSFTKFLAGDPGTFHTNVLTANARDLDGNLAQAQDNEQVGFVDQLPSISMTKSAFPTSIDEPGGYIDFTFQISNDSQEVVTITSLSDSVYGDLSQASGCENAIGQSIAPDGSYSCTISGLVTGDAGDVHQNTAMAVVTDNDDNTATASDSASVNISNVPTVIDVTKSANPTEVTEPGDSVTFSVAVENLSEEAITLTSLVDDIYGDLDGQGDCEVPQTIAIGSSYSCSFSAQVTGDAGDLHINTVTGTAEDNEGGSVTDTGSAQVIVTDAPPAIQVIKSASPESAPAPLAAITYTVEVQNLTAEAVTLNQLVDDKFGDLDGSGDCQIGGSIPAGGSYSCSFIKNIAGASGDSHINVVTATVSDNEDNSASGSDDATVVFTNSPEMRLVDPCTVGCDLPVVTGQLCNGDAENDYTGTVNWTAYVDNTPIGSGTVQGVPAGECVALTAPRSGDGLYSIVAVMVDEDNRELVTSCGPLSCTVDPRPTPTPIPPVNPPSGTPTGVFIPVTGMDLSGNSLIAKLQNFGFALISLGLVLHGFTVKENKQKKSAK
ncbi:MAG: hypothetical protein JW757_13115 [Anaerolineales bacterium]|nr:hypothetical protein [Anaerolineales bacterium]